MFSFLFGNFTKQALVTPALNPSTWKAEVGRSEFSASSSLQIKFQDSQGYTKKPYLNNNKYIEMNIFFCTNPVFEPSFLGMNSTTELCLQFPNISY